MMPPFLLKLLANRWIVGGVLAALLIGAVGWYFYSKGKAAGEEKAKQEEKQHIEEARKEERAVLDKRMAAADAVIEGWKQAYDSSTARELRQAQVINALQQQRVERRQEVARLDDSALRPYIIQQIGKRRPGDATACYTAEEERVIADAITDQPLCQKTVDEQTKLRQEAENSKAALNGQIKSIESKVDALTVYVTQLEGHYTVLYNLFPKKRRAPKCLWLWGCGKVTLNLPAPEELKR